jgi:hypothetical protein
MFFPARILALLILISMPSGNLLFSHVLYINAADDQRTGDLGAFLEDPVANFNRIKEIPNLCDRIISEYELKQIPQGSREPRQGFLDLLFTRHFQEVDEKKIQIAIYLYRHLRGCYGEIVDKIEMVFCLQPVMFVTELANEKDWQNIIDGLSMKWGAFSVGLCRLGDSEFEREVKGYAILKHMEREQKISLIEAFFVDPVMYFERIRTWDDVCEWIGQYEDQLCGDEGSGQLLMQKFLESHFQEVDEKKIEILIHLVTRCHGAYGELLSDETAKNFWLHSQMFINILEKTEDWKRVIDKISMLSWSYFSRGLMELGDTEFEKSLKEYIGKKIKKDSECQ